MGKENHELREGEDPEELIENFAYDQKYRQFPQVVHYRGQAYDARNDQGQTCIYRMTAEHRMDMEEPDYIEVDRQGRVLRTIK